ncbi:hypothetical protein BDN72DRAFT_841287 [Pluteus cervinus]|uniref:Uncharacterized protein n=1 Tax=Pluteus cervinus TaxID=181527 RepID=A0ACD3AS85_9AGAR|nr:hypothetical protein BDN72DRAFT_841287 [Pluteus cervinus]
MKQVKAKSSESEPWSKHKRYYQKNKAVLREKSRLRMAERRITRQRAQCSTSSLTGGDGDNAESISAAPDPISYVDLVFKQTDNWLAEWGALSSWGNNIRSQFLALESGDVDNWTKRILSHAERGHLILTMLGAFGMTLPFDKSEICQLWQRQWVATIDITKGLAIIDCHLLIDLGIKGPFTGGF